MCNKKEEKHVHIIVNCHLSYKIIESKLTQEILFYLIEAIVLNCS